jgi:hypothetical protein
MITGYMQVRRQCFEQAIGHEHTGSRAAHQPLQRLPGFAAKRVGTT